MKENLKEDIDRVKEIMGLLGEQYAGGKGQKCNCNGVELGPFPEGTDCSKKCDELAEKNCNPKTHRYYKRADLAKTGKVGCVKLTKEELEKNRRAALSPEERKKEDILIAQGKLEALPYKKPETKVPRIEPRVFVKKLKGGKISITAKGEFPVNVTESGLSDAFIEKVVETIAENPDGAKMLETGNMNITFATLKGSASNYFDGPVAPTVSNNQKEPKLKDKSYYTGNEAKNNKLALKRAQNLFAELQKKLPGKRINISAKPKFTQVITDTGGVYDEWRDVRKRPRGGQFVTVKATLELIPLEIIEEIRCLTDMEVTVGYYADVNKLQLAMDKAEGSYKVGLKNSISHAQKINKGRANKKGHGCNSAEFEVWLNKSRIGRINLNNGANAPGEWAKDAAPNTPGGSREKKLIVKNATATRIAKDTVDRGGVVTFYLKPISKNSHSDTPWVKIVTGQGKVLIDKAAEDISTYNADRGSSGMMKIFGPFDPCKAIT
eukprot:SAG11_NODE_67_length_18762_cov_13.942560_7_plen_493_part_00